MPKILGKATMLSMLALKLAAAADTESPNEPIPKPECDSSQAVSIRYSSGSERLYLESGDGSTRGGCVTLRQIWENRGGKAPLYAVDPDTGDISDTVTGTWLLTEELFVEDGITLKVSRLIFPCPLVVHTHARCFVLALCRDVLVRVHPGSERFPWNSLGHRSKLFHRHSQL